MGKVNVGNEVTEIVHALRALADEFESRSRQGQPSPAEIVVVNHIHAVEDPRLGGMATGHKYVGKSLVFHFDGGNNAMLLDALEKELRP